MPGYYKEGQLGRFGEIGAGAPALAEQYFAWYGKTFEDGALTAREKALIALAVAHTVQCPYCIDAYANGCVENGSSKEEMMEAIHVAGVIRAGASLVHGVQTIEHLEAKGAWSDE
jgi:4-carboxymuconolactone decarboxylase